MHLLRMGNLFRSDRRLARGWSEYVYKELKFRAPPTCPSTKQLGHWFATSTNVRTGLLHFLLETAAQQSRF